MPERLGRVSLYGFVALFFAALIVGATVSQSAGVAIFVAAMFLAIVSEVASP